MPPKFSLQPVLNYRHNRVEALEIELGQLLASQQRGNAFMESLNNYKSNLFDELNHQQSGEMDMLTVTHVRSNLKVVEERIRQQKQVLMELERQVSSKRLEVVEAKQGEETLIKLKDRETERFQAEQARQENRMQDDIYISQAFRRASNAYKTSGIDG